MTRRPTRCCCRPGRVLMPCRTGRRAAAPRRWLQQTQPWPAPSLQQWAGQMSPVLALMLCWWQQMPLMLPVALCLAAMQELLAPSVREVQRASRGLRRWVVVVLLLLVWMRGAAWVLSGAWMMAAAWSFQSWQCSRDGHIETMCRVKRAGLMASQDCWGVDQLWWAVSAGCLAVFCVLHCMQYGSAFVFFCISFLHFGRGGFPTEGLLACKLPLFSMLSSLCLELISCS
ncbi:hypothetical protein COO60DRAFT_533830 [Scenedesmus sp. NREL 46B-D3]|nr:hypothetical protein COO60DRAFT_533830 [Scenedesmus sp. NREL 46B-D3]